MAKDFIEFDPVDFVIQKRQTMSVHVRLKLTEKISQYLAEFIKEDVLLVPFQAFAEKQVKPIDFALRAVLSNDTLTFSS